MRIFCQVLLRLDGCDAVLNFAKYRSLGGGRCLLDYSRSDENSNQPLPILYACRLLSVFYATCSNG